VDYLILNCIGHHLIGFGSSDILSAIAVVESLDEMDHANARVMMEVLIVMGLRFFLVTLHTIDPRLITVL